MSLGLLLLGGFLLMIVVDLRSEYSPFHIKVLTVLLSPSTIDRELPSTGASISQDVAKYMLQRRYFPLLRMALERIVRICSHPTLAVQPY